MQEKETKENWDKQKMLLKQKFPWLTEQDLTYEEGKKEKMLEKLQISLGKTKDDLNKLINAL